jgi:hypothetical protein
MYNKGIPSCCKVIDDVLATQLISNAKAGFNKHLKISNKLIRCRYFAVWIILWLRGMGASIELFQIGV